MGDRLNSANRFGYKIMKQQSIENKFCPPYPSRSSRRITAKSNVSGRGILPCLLPSWDRPRKVVYESILELKVLYILLSRSDIWDLQEQPPATKYRLMSGKAKSTYFDFLITLRSGHKIAIAVKPADIVERSGFRNELEIIRTATPLDFAHEVVLVTDRSFKPHEYHNAEKLHEFRKHPDDEADQIIIDAMIKQSFETTIADIAHSTGLYSRGFRAAFRLIYAGRVTALDTGDITPKSRIIAGGLL